MCQAYEGEARYVLSVELRYGTYHAMLAGQEPLPDYCYKCQNYWCGCKSEQNDPVIRAERSKRYELARLAKSASSSRE